MKNFQPAGENGAGEAKRIESMEGLPENRPTKDTTLKNDGKKTNNDELKKKREDKDG